MLFVAGIGCQPPGMASARFVVPVDSISAPDTIAPSGPLIVHFRGRLGPDQCSTLERVEVHRSVGAMAFVFHGRRTSDGDCLQMPAVLEHVETILPPLQDPFTIRVRQPDGTELVRTVRVR